MRTHATCSGNSTAAILHDVFWPVFGFVVGLSDEDINNSASKNLPDYVERPKWGMFMCVGRKNTATLAQCASAKIELDVRSSAGKEDMPIDDPK
jgi:hypothetical protein